MSTALTPYTEDIPVCAGMEELDSKDYIVPRRKLMQGTSKVEGMVDIMPGTFVDVSAKRTVGKSMQVIVLLIKVGRTLYWERASGKEGRRCWSHDGKTPSAQVEFPVSSSCGNCEEAWKDKTFSLLCLDVKETLEIGSPVMFWMTASKTSRRPTQEFLSAVASRQKHLFATRTTIASVRQESDRGEPYFTLGFSDMAFLNPNDEKDEELYVLAKAAFLRMQSAATSAPDEDAVDAPVSSSDRSL